MLSTVAQVVTIPQAKAHTNVTNHQKDHTKTKINAEIIGILKVHLSKIKKPRETTNMIELMKRDIKVLVEVPKA